MVKKEIKSMKSVKGNPRAKTKKGVKKNRPQKQHNPNKLSHGILKSTDPKDLRAELERIEELNSKRPAKDLKNKEKRRELLYLRNSMKNRIKAKLRRRTQKAKEEMGDDYNDEAPKTKTIESMREKDDTFVDLENDEELKEEVENDEYTDYFNKTYDPQILITTSIKHTGAIFRFVKEVKDIIPNVYFYPRKKFNLKDIVEMAKGKGFTDIIVVYERLRKPYRMTVTHLNDGPTAEFKISNVVYHNEIEDCARNTNHNPELIFKNFKTKTGFRLSRILNALFPHTPEMNGRQVITFHNQRDFIFFRFHRYIFNEEFKSVSLQEIGPRFCLRLLSIQKGTFDSQFGEYEWYYKNKMGVRRRKFNI
jgi:ribosome production factor 1